MREPYETEALTNNLNVIESSYLKEKLPKQPTILVVRIFIWKYSHLLRQFQKVWPYSVEGRR